MVVMIIFNGYIKGVNSVLEQSLNIILLEKSCQDDVWRHTHTHDLPAELCRFILII